MNLDLFISKDSITAMVSVGIALPSDLCQGWRRKQPVIYKNSTDWSRSLCLNAADLNIN